MRLFTMTTSVVVAVGLAGSAASARRHKNYPPPPPPLGATVTKSDQAGQSRQLYLDLIAGMRRTGRIHAALAHLDAFDKQYPNSADALVLRGDCLVDLKDYAGAQIVYGQLLKGKEAAAAHAGLGRIEASGGRWAEASAQFKLAVGLAPTKPDYLSDYGFALLQSGDQADALFRIRQAAELAPADTRVRNNLIIALAANGSDAEAQSLLSAITDPVERHEIEALAAQATTTATGLKPVAER